MLHSRRQGQARGYGRITHKRGRTTGGHYFQDLFTAKPLDIYHFLGYQTKDLNIVFSKIPHDALWVQWFGNGTWVVFDVFQKMAINPK